MAGDVADINQNEKDNKNRLLYYSELALQGKDYDVYLAQYGQLTYAEILSWSAFDEFESMVPHKIDRSDHSGGNPFGNIVKGSLGIAESTKECIERRKELIRLIGNNKISKYYRIDTVNKSEYINKFNSSSLKLQKLL